MQHGSAQEHPQSIEMNLREQLLAASGGPNASPYPPPPAPGAQGPEHPYQPSDSASPREHLGQHVAQQQHQGPYAQMSGDSPGDDGMSQPSSKGKRELSTSKRAAQNRAAQRAFRQRKEGYIKKLEEQVKEFQTMEQNYRTLQNENFQLREYILNLQSRLLETQSDVPPAPLHIGLSSSGAAALAAGGGGAGARPSSTGDQRLHRDVPQQGHPTQRSHEPRDAISQLQAAAAHAEAASRPQHEPPYGLGTDHSKKPRRTQEIAAAAGNLKSSP